jgi:hypothetical protein
VQPLCEAYTSNEAGVVVCRNFFGSPAFTKLVKNPLFEAISLYGPMGPLKNRSENGLNAYFSKAIAIIYNPKGYEITGSINFAESPKTKCSIHRPT